jgi:hypothetical protein
MRRDEVEGDGGLVVGLEVSPVQRHDDLVARGHDERNPVREPLPDVDASIREQPVDLLDRVLHVEPARRSERATYRMNAQRGAVTEHRARRW